MTKIVAIALALATLVCGTAIARAESPAWTDVIKTCSAEYKERADKTKGREVWQAFLTDCKTRKGFVPKRQAASTVEFTRVPDKQ
jgi:hypothetical protein